MGKKKAFLNKKDAKRFRLIPSSGPVQEEGQKFTPTQEHLDEQHKYGIYYDDDYDYTQHLRDVKEGFALQSMEPEDQEEEERVIIRAPKRPPMPSILFGEGSSAPVKNSTEAFDEDIDRVLEGDFEAASGELEDDFIALAGGAAVKEQLVKYRNRDEEDSGSEEDSEEEDDMYDENYGDFEEDYGPETDVAPVRRDGPQREIDNAFDTLLDADYNEDQLGELDGDELDVAGFLEPDDGRLKRLTKEKKSDPEYDEQLAKDYVRQRMALIESGAIKEDETEIVEVDESCKKRMKWDCESFATQYTNIYNHPTLIKDPAGRLSRRALKKLDRDAAKADAAAGDVEMMEEDEEMEDDSSQCTTMSTIRPKGETPEQRRLRKQAVKEARRFRREEKKGNKTAFAEEFRKVAKARAGQIKAKPIL